MATLLASGAGRVPARTGIRSVRALQTSRRLRLHAVQVDVVHLGAIAAITGRRRVWHQAPRAPQRGRAAAPRPAWFEAVLERVARA